jgi:phasin family protein
MADKKSETKTAKAETEPKAATATVVAAPAAPTAPAEAPAAEKASQPAPKAEKAAEPAKAEAAAEPAPKAEKAPEPAPAPVATAPKAAPAAAVKAVRARRLRKPVAVKATKAKPTKVTIEKKPARKPAVTKSVTAAAKRPVIQAARPAFKTQNEGPRTMTNEATKIADRVQAVFGDVNAKAKEAFERNTKVAEELTELTKGNVEAFVASTKLAAKGAESLGQEVAEFGRKSFEDASAALKSFAEVKSPTDLFRLQSEFARAQFDAIVAEGSKLSETVLKLAGDVAEPLTSRYAVAAEKAKAVVAF